MFTNYYSKIDTEFYCYLFLFKNKLNMSRLISKLISTETKFTKLIIFIKTECVKIESYTDGMN